MPEDGDIRTAGRHVDLAGAAVLPAAAGFLAAG